MSYCDYDDVTPRDTIQTILTALGRENAAAWRALGLMSRPLAAMGYLDPDKLCPQGDDDQATQPSHRVYHSVTLTTDLDRDLALLSEDQVTGDQLWQEGLVLADSLYNDVYYIHGAATAEAKMTTAVYEVLLGQLTPHARSLALLLLAGMPETSTRRSSAIVTVLSLVHDSGDLGGPLEGLAYERMAACTDIVWGDIAGDLLRSSPVRSLLGSSPGSPVGSPRGA